MPIVGAQAYENSIINALAVSDPQLNTALGTPVRKIITAVAQEMAAYNVDVNVTGTLYSIDSVSGFELDYLVGQFGFTRHAARAARGVVTFNRDSGDTLMQIPFGSYVYKPATSGVEAVAFQTTAYQEMAEGVLSCDIAIVAVEAGSLGNVPAHTISYFGSAGEYMVVDNENPTSGGRDAETDEQLRKRFLLTVFRNVAGTADQILGLALANSMVNRANLIGQESRYSETVQVATLELSPDTATASVSNEKWNLDVERCLDVERRYWVRMADTQELLSRGDYSVSQDGKVVTFVPRSGSDAVGPIEVGGTYRLSHGDIVESTVSVVRDDSMAVVPSADYSIDAENGTITVVDDDGSSVTWSVSYGYNFVGDGDFVTIEFDYFSKHNRGGIKTVDLFVDCLSSKNVTDIQYIDFDKEIDAVNKLDWAREDGSNPGEGHLYVPLSYQPVVSHSGYVSMGVSTVLYEGRHYNVIWDDTKTAGSCRGMDAIELLGEVVGSSFVFDDGGGAMSVPDETPISIPYVHDYSVEDVQKVIDAQRVVTMDIQVHEAVHRYFVIYLSLMFSTFPKDSVIENVKGNVLKWSDSLPFGHTVQLSDIETVAANTAGVDNVRTATAGDAGGKLAPYDDGSGNLHGAYGIIELYRDGSTFRSQFTNDFRLAENEVFEVQEVVVYPRTQQSWGG